MENKLIVSLSPHVHGGDSVQKNMYGVLIALIPAFLVSLYFFGLGALIVTATSVAACLFFEWAIGKYLMKKPTSTICDGSAVITGVLLAFNLPSNLPVWIIILGALFAIGVGKMSFGGLGCNPFNPALAGRVFLLLSFPVQMTSWPVVGQLTAYTDATTGATPLAIMKGIIGGVQGFSIDQLPDSFSLLIGQNGGCIGEVSALALLIGLGYMLWKKIITWHIPVSILVTVFVFAGIMHLVDPAKYVSPVLQLLSGVIAALSALKEPCHVLLTTDSKYVVDSVTKGWVYGWQKRGWVKSDKKPALNVDLWKQLLPLLEKHQVTFHWVKGHAGHPENERCDQLAVMQRDRNA